MREIIAGVVGAGLTAALAGGPPTAAHAGSGLTVFGDSYSVPVRDGVRDWPVLLREKGLAGRLDDFAESGGSATPRNRRSFGGQVRRWAGAGRPLGDTVVYLGYVDIGFIGGDLAKARAGYRAGIDALVRAGATRRGNRLLLVLPHDVGATPLFDRTRERRPLRRLTEEWDGFVRATARKAGATVVDVFAVLDRVRRDPRRYGLTNVTTAEDGRSGATALYRQPFHVGQRGQEIIAQAIAARLR